MGGPSGVRAHAAESYWRQPARWQREAKAAGERRRVFCASLADVFELREDLDPARARWPTVAPKPKPRMTALLMWWRGLETPMSDEKFPSKWEFVAGLSRLRVPGGWLVEWGANDSAPQWFPDPAGAWVVEPEPVEPVAAKLEPATAPAPAAPALPKPPTWDERCRVIGANDLHHKGVGRDECGWCGGSMWMSHRVPMTVAADGGVTLWSSRETMGRGFGAALREGGRWIVADSSPLRVEAERVLSVAEAVRAEHKAAAEAAEARKVLEVKAERRAMIAAAESVLREVDHV